MGWSVEYRTDGYCWTHKKVIQTIEGDMALFLHEVAHALCEIVQGDQHHGIWAGHYTDLVRRYMK